MNANIEVQDTEITAAFARMIAVGESPRLYLGAIGNALADNTRLRFNEGVTPDGAPWAPLTRTTMLRRLQGRSGNFRKSGALSAKGRRVAAGGFKPLLDTGRLRNSITSNVDGNSVVVGTNVIYGALQQFGAKEGQFGRYSQLSRLNYIGNARNLGGASFLRRKDEFIRKAGTVRGFPIPWGDIPGRPFLGISDFDRQHVNYIIERAITAEKS